MKNTIIYGSIIIMIVTLSGCITNVNQDENILECYTDADCHPFSEICVSGICTYVDCNSGIGCAPWDSCINYECINFHDDCINISKIDYNMTNPICENVGKKCWCKDRIIDVEEKRIENEKSFTIIPAEYHDTEKVHFVLK